MGWLEASEVDGLSRLRDRDTLIVPFVRRLKLHFLGWAIDRRRAERGESPNVVGDAAPAPPDKPEHIDCLQ